MHKPSFRRRPESILIFVRQSKMGPGFRRDDEMERFCELEA
jgi:hypothetical protein